MWNIFCKTDFFLIITLRHLYFCRFNSEMSKVLPKNVLSSSQLPPIIVPNLMGLTWDLLGTYLGLTTDLVLGKLCLSMNGSIPNASRTHPEGEYSNGLHKNSGGNLVCKTLLV